MKKVVLSLFLFFILFLVGCTSAKVDFTISFDSNGGSEVESLTTDGESRIKMPEDPSKEGYVFGGWYWDNNTFSDPFTTNSLLDAPLSSNATVYAKWNESDEQPPGTIIVTFHSMGGTSVPEVYVLKGSTVSIPNVTREGYTLEGWYTSLNMGETLDEEWSFTSSEANNDITLYAKWIVNQYTLSFDTNEGTTIDSTTNDYHSVILKPNDPIKEGYTFIGWYESNDYIEEYSFTTMPAKDITLYAKWEINQYTITYIIYDGYYDSLHDILLYEGESLVSISLGYNHTTAITSEGRVFTWGNNSYGQLGDGTTTHRSIPTDITSQFGLHVGETLTSVKAGYNHSSAITSEGRVFTWGFNDYEQLGDGTKINRNIPTEITSQFGLHVGETVTSISLGQRHSSAITSEGRVFTWGYNAFGQLGDGTTIGRNIPTEITSQFGLAVGETVTSITLGSLHSSAITSTGRVFIWGNNNYGRLGDGTTTHQITPLEITSQFGLTVGETIITMSLGGYHSSAITSKGRVFTWGRNWYGELGEGTTTTQRIIPIEITGQFGLIRGETVTSLKLGSNHSSAITSLGRVFIWGHNGFGELGDGTTNSRNTPLEITSQFGLIAGEKVAMMSLGGSHSSAITSEERIFTWGYSNYGQLGDGSTITQLIPKSLPITTLFPIETSTFDYNETLVEYLPVLEGYTFDGWYSNIELTEEYVFTTMPAEDITLYARWILN